MGLSRKTLDHRGAASMNAPVLQRDDWRRRDDPCCALQRDGWCLGQGPWTSAGTALCPPRPLAATTTMVAIPLRKLGLAGVVTLSFSGRARRATSTSAIYPICCVGARGGSTGHYVGRDDVSGNVTAKNLTLNRRRVAYKRDTNTKGSRLESKNGCGKNEARPPSPHRARG